MDNQQLVVQEQERTQIVVGQDFGQRSEIRELAERLRAGLQNGTKLPQDGVIALATMCVAHGFDPFNGEAYLCIDEKKGEHWVQPGIKGLRKLAKKQMPNGEYIDTPCVPIPQSEWEELGIPNDAKIAARCALRRSDATMRYLDNLERAIAAMGGDVKAAQELIGLPPVWVGIGYVEGWSKSRMPLPQLVNKRAEMHALRQAFDLPFRYETDGDYQAVGFELDEEPLPQLEDPGRTLYGDPDFEGFGDVVPGEVVEKRAPQAAAKPPSRAAASKQAPASGDTPETPQNGAQGTPDGLPVEDINDLYDRHMSELEGTDITRVIQYSRANSDVTHFAHWQARLKKYYPEATGGDVRLVDATVPDFIEGMATKRPEKEQAA